MKTTRLYITLFLVTLSFIINAQEYAIGADLSFLKEAEDNDFVFKDNGKPTDGLTSLIKFLEPFISPFLFIERTKC